MKRFYIISLFFIILSLFGDNRTLFENGNSSYKKGNYEEAVKYYLEIINQGAENGEVYYNTGNSYYKLGNIASAIKYYELAKKYIPGDDDLNENLRIARLSIVDRIEEKPVLPFMKYYYSLKNSYNIVSSRNALLISIFILSVLISFYFFNESRGLKKLIITGKVVTSIYIIFIFSVFMGLRADNSLLYGVINTEKVSILSSPDNNSNSTELFALHTGTKVCVEKEIDGWLEISLDKDKKGWIKKDDILLIK